MCGQQTNTMPFQGEIDEAAQILSSVAALRRHPGFQRATRSAAEGVVALYRADRILNALMSDRARALFTHAALYLHYSGTRPGETGLTVGAMKDMCIEHGLCSRGRCEAMLALMRAAGLFVAAPDRDRRRRPLAPTEKLFGMHRERWGRHFEAMQHVMPEAETWRDALADPGFVAAFVVALVRRFMGGQRLVEPASGFELFTERNAGMMILFDLALQGPKDGGFPATVPVRLSINALATKYLVSRKHVLTLLRDAETRRMLARGGLANDAVTILAPAREGLETFQALLFLYLARSAEEAMRACASASVPLGVAI
jgi:hypothetical protein